MGNRSHQRNTPLYTVNLPLLDTPVIVPLIVCGISVMVVVCVYVPPEVTITCEATETFWPAIMLELSNVAENGRFDGTASSPESLKAVLASNEYFMRVLPGTRLWLNSSFVRPSSKKWPCEPNTVPSGPVSTFVALGSSTSMRVASSEPSD